MMRKESRNRRSQRNKIIIGGKGKAREDNSQNKSETKEIKLK